MTDSGAATVAGLLAAQAAAFLALLLAASATHKAFGFGRAQRAARELLGVPPAAAGAAVIAAVIGAGLAEAASAVSLASPQTRARGAALAAGIFGAYLALIASAIVRGRRDIDCACSFGGTRRALGRFELGRNFVLVALAAWVSASSAHAAAPVAASQALAACAFLALYVALEQTAGLDALRKGAVP